MECPNLRSQATQHQNIFPVNGIHHREINPLAERLPYLAAFETQIARADPPPPAPAAGWIAPCSPTPEPWDGHS